MCGSGVDFDTFGNATALVEYSTTMVLLAEVTDFPFSSKQDEIHFWRCYYMQEITFFCTRCKTSLTIKYKVTGNDNAPVLPNIEIACRHCTRVLYLKKYTEKQLIENSVGGKFYI